MADLTSRLDPVGSRVQSCQSGICRDAGEFRGSRGYGRAHLEAGYREVGVKIRTDSRTAREVADLAGIADPDRIGIPRQLWRLRDARGLVKTPELYRAGAEYASVTDIEY